MAVSFGDLSPEIRDLGPTVANAIGGAILGVVSDAGGATVRYSRVAEAAIVACYDYAPSAPISLLREASIRLAGWILGTRPHASGSRSEDPSGTSLQLEFTNKQATANGMRSSGASALLSRFVVRRALAI